MRDVRILVQKNCKETTFWFYKKDATEITTAKNNSLYITEHGKLIEYTYFTGAYSLINKGEACVWLIKNNIEDSIVPEFLIKELNKRHLK